MLDESKKNDLQQTLKDIRRDPGNMEDLFKELEDKSQLDSLFSDASQYGLFYREYTAKLIQKYVLDIDKQEIILAAYGLLDEYQKLRKVNSRRMRYAERAVGVNQLIDPTWANPDESLSKIEDGVIEQLVNRLIKEATDNPEKKGWLNFTNTVANDLLERFPNGFPAELPLPIPKYRRVSTETRTTGPKPEPMAGAEPKPEVSPLSYEPQESSSRQSLIRLQWFLPVLLVAAFLIYIRFPHSADKISGENITLMPGEVRQFNDCVFYGLSDEDVDKIIDKVADRVLEYASSDPSLITVSPSGFLMAHQGKPGETSRTAEITVQDENGVITTQSFTVDFTKESFDPPVEDINDFVPEFTVSQKIRIADDTEWHNYVDAEVGDELEIQFEYRNISDERHSNVAVRDILPTNLEYIPGSTTIYTTQTPTGLKKEDGIVGNGIYIGTYGSNSNAYVRFRVRVVDINLADGVTGLVNWSQSCVNGVTLQDYATVRVTK